MSSPYKTSAVIPNSGIPQGYVALSQAEYEAFLAMQALQPPKIFEPVITLDGQLIYTIAGKVIMQYGGDNVS